MAAQLLSGQGFREVYNLKGGIKAWQGVKAVGPVELNLDLIRGDESPGEIIILAYGMEEALRRFYSRFEAAAARGEIKRPFPAPGRRRGETPGTAQESLPGDGSFPRGGGAACFSRRFAGPGGRIPV